MKAEAKSGSGGADPVRRTQAGQVRGMCDGRVCRFLGIPYAAPPVGDNRFREPQPPPRWSGARDATRPGASAPQRIADFPILDLTPLVGDGRARGDDYLTLNIWAPADAGPGDSRPVLIFVHGGGFVIGSKDAAVGDGSAFARSGLICVAINYRLGIEGFLPIPSVPTNLGLRDILFAIAWVRENIGHFGGDPANITLFGESAGGMAIAGLIASPLAAGLFKRAVVQSGHGSMVREIPIARRLVERLAGAMRVSADAEGFRGTSFDQGLEAIGRLSEPSAAPDLRDSAGHEPVFGISLFIPVYGDDVLPLHPLQALAEGAGSDIALLIGSNADEMNLHLVPTGVKDAIAESQARDLVGRFNPHAGDVLAAYGLGRAGRRPGEALAEAMADMVFRWPARQFAAAHRGRTHVYEMDWQSTACAGALGACHCIELGFVFDTLPSVTGPAGLAGEAPPQALAERIHALWTGFATDGSLPWEPFTRTNRRVRRLAAGETVDEPVMPAAPFLP